MELPQSLVGWASPTDFFRGKRWGAMPTLRRLIGRASPRGFPFSRRRSGTWSEGTDGATTGEGKEQIQFHQEDPPKSVEALLKEDLGRERDRAGRGVGGRGLRHGVERGIQDLGEP